MDAIVSFLKIALRLLCFQSQRFDPECLDFLVVVAGSTVGLEQVVRKQGFIGGTYLAIICLSCTSRA